MTADDGASALAAIPFVESWACAFPSGSPRVVMVLPPCTWPTAEAPSSFDAVAEYVQRLADRGVVASLDVLNERDARHALLAHAASIGDTILVVTSPRFRDGLSQWYDTTRMLLRCATRPVLVVPKDLA